LSPRRWLSHGGSATEFDRGSLKISMVKYKSSQEVFMAAWLIAIPGLLFAIIPMICGRLRFAI
jgi:hypothetical protein